MAAPKYRFTSFDLQSCLEVARSIHDNGGLLSSAQLAAYLNYKSDNNGSFNTRLANARLFGLIEGTVNSLKATDRALAILHPDYPAVRDEALLDAFESVPLYKAFLDQYHGQTLPDDTGMRNALTTRWEIDAEKAPMVLSRLMESAEQAGLFRTLGNRSRMIRPVAGRGEDVAGDQRNDDRRRTTTAETSTRLEEPRRGGGVRTNKIIDGVLEMLPEEPEWDESNLRHWLRFFEDALRLYYKLPRQAEASGFPASNGAGSVVREEGR